MMKAKGTDSRWLFAAGCATSIAIVLTLLVIALRVTFTAHLQTAANMEPTIKRGDRVIVRRPRTIERRDVVAVPMPRSRAGALMRVIGLPGELVEMRGGVAVINGVTLEEPYIQLLEGPGSEIPVVRDFGPVQVPADAFFVLGDNRDHANDSRFIGFIKRDEIRGEVVAVLSPTDGFRRL